MSAVVRELMTRRWLAGVPIASGLCWILAGMGQGWVMLLSLLPGLLHAGIGLVLLFKPGDRRVTQALAASCFPALLLMLPLLATGGLAWPLALLLLTVACFVAAGFSALRHEPRLEGLPEFKATLALALWVALDDALLGYFTLTARLPRGTRAKRMSEDCERVRQCHRTRTAETFHQPPAPLRDAQIRQRSSLGQAYEHLSFDSGYAPPIGEPGAQAWLANARNRRAHAWVLRHAGAPRPWLVCIHGYRMGLPWMDFGLFRPQWLHRRLGLNLLMPVLPLHGPRRAGLRSGDGYMDGDFPNFLHAEAQAMHDIRSQIRWLRESQQATTVGVLGYSLGGYNAALLACLEDDLACVIAGIPMADIAATLWRHMPAAQLRYLDSHGLNAELAREALQPVSPLLLPPKTERRYIFAGMADRLIPPQQVLELARHWQVPEVAWYRGTHLSFGREAVVSGLILQALREGGLLSA